MKTVAEWQEILDPYATEYPPAFSVLLVSLLQDMATLERVAQQVPLLEEKIDRLEETLDCEMRGDSQ